jgi:hypothetical protein
MPDESGQSGARFFDEHSRDRGWAGKVTRRVHQLGGLTVLDVVAAEPELASFLTALDRGRITVQPTGTLGDAYVFQWASGYDNGAQIRIQGVIDPRSDAASRRS